MPIPEFVLSLRKRVGHELLFLPGVAAIVPDEQGRILCLRRSDTGRWSFPSGIVEPGENPSYTIVREIFEETGLRALPERLLSVFWGPRVHYANGDESEYTTTLFLCRIRDGTLEARDGEALELRFFPADQLPSIPLLELFPCPLAELITTREAVFPWSDDWLDALE